MTVTPSRFHWKFKALATIDQAPPVVNTWYPILDTTSKVRLYSMGVKQVNDEAAEQIIQMRLVIDGITTSANGIATANNSMRYFYVNPVNENLTVQGATTFFNAGYYVATHGKSLKVEARVLGVGTTQHLYGYVRYAKLEAL